MAPYRESSFILLLALFSYKKFCCHTNAQTLQLAHIVGYDSQFMIHALCFKWNIQINKTSNQFMILKYADWLIKLRRVQKKVCDC